MQCCLSENLSAQCLRIFLSAQVGGARCRQHVNPLKRELAAPAPALEWDEVYADPTRPLVLDVGSGYGRFLLALAHAKPGHNMLGLEIRTQVGRHRRAGQLVPPSSQLGRAALPGQCMRPRHTWGPTLVGQRRLGLPASHMGQCVLACRLSTEPTCGPKSCK
jgi:hypothetical protein